MQVGDRPWGFNDLEAPHWGRKVGVNLSKSLVDTPASRHTAESAALHSYDLRDRDRRRAEMISGRRRGKRVFVCGLQKG